MGGPDAVGPAYVLYSILSWGVLNTKQGYTSGRDTVEP